MSRKLIKLFTFLFFFLAGITWVAGDAGEGVSGRLIMADLLGILIISLFVIVTLLFRRGRILFPKTYMAFLVLFISFFVSGVFAPFPNKAMFELVILLFIFLVSLSLVNLWIFIELKPEDILKYLLWAGAVLSLIGLAQFFFFKGLFAGTHGGLSGTFRNTGQAGAFFGTYLAVLIPAFLSNKLRANYINLLLLFVIVLALIFTIKRAAIIGFFSGFILVLFYLLLSNNVRDKYLSIKIFLGLFFVTPIIFFVMNWGLNNVDGMLWRMESKVSSSAVEDFSEGFLAENIHYTLKAFELSPLIGVGLGNVAGYISTKYEIHSTYMAVLATGGILGCASYFLFMMAWFNTLKKTMRSPEWRKFTTLIILMVVGLIISWSYTYHIRKREFWILLSLTLFIYSYIGIRKEVTSNK